MKVGIRQNVLLNILEKGSVAAMSADAQADMSTLAILTKAVKITVDKQFVVESNTELFAVKCNTLATEENGITVKEIGSVVVAAKELIDWIKLQGSDAIIGLVFQKIDVPEIIVTSEEAGTDNSDKTKFSVKKVGVLKLSSKGTAQSKTQTRWEIDCFDPANKVAVNFDEKADQIFEMSGQQFSDSLDNVRFAVLPKDPNHILDSISMQVYNNGLYFAGTDMQHCAIYKCPSTVTIGVNKPLLIPAMLLDNAMKIVNKDDKIAFLYNEDKDKVYINQPNLQMRVVCTEKRKISAFPSLEGLLKKPYNILTECSKESMIGLLRNASFINSSSASFVFLKDNGTLTVKAMDEDSKLKPNVRQCEIGTISRDAKAIWGVDHLLGALKAIKSTDIQLQLPDNMGSLKITSKDNVDFCYFTMALENPLYTTHE